MSVVCWCKQKTADEMRLSVFFLQAGVGIRDLVRSRELGDVCERQPDKMPSFSTSDLMPGLNGAHTVNIIILYRRCFLYTFDASDDPPCVHPGVRRSSRRQTTLCHSPWSPYP